jgi:hypothetical protein
MVLEYTQLLSTAHRVIDGIESTGKSASGRMIHRWVLPDDREGKLYKATHINHPSAIWCRQSTSNYMWLYNLLTDLCKEYTYRYGKIHKVEASGLLKALYYTPAKIAIGPFTEPTPAMDEKYKIQNNSLASYRNYYINSKQHLASWRGKINSRSIPEWFNA